MKRVISAFVLVALLAMMLSGCSTTKSYTFNVSSGDRVKVELETGDGYSIRQSDGEFTVTKDGNEIFTGRFGLEAQVKQYAEALGKAIGVESCECESIAGKDGFSDITVYSYTYSYEKNEPEIDFIVFIDGSNTAVILKGMSEEDNARAAFERLSFAVE